MKKYFPFFLLFYLFLTGCGQAGRTYTPTVITSSQILMSFASTQNIDNVIEDTSSILSETSSAISSAASSQKSSMTSSRATSSKISSSVNSITASSKSTSSQQSSSNLVLSSVSSTVSSFPNSKDIEVLSLTSPIVRGQEATITVKGVPGKQYSIKVIYKSGPSKAGGLEPKTTGSDGIVTWTWKVGAQTTSGNWRIEISGGESTLSVPFVVTE